MTTHTTTTQTTSDAHLTVAEMAPANAELAAALQEAARRLCCQPQPSAASDEPAHMAAAVTRRFLNSLEQGNLSALEDIVCDDLVYRIPGRSRIAGVHEGIEGITVACGIVPRPGAKELRSELTGLIPDASGEHVATFHTMTGRLDGQPIDIDIALRFTLRNGRIAAITEYSADQHAADDLFAR